MYCCCTVQSPTRYIVSNSRRINATNLVAFLSGFHSRLFRFISSLVAYPGRIISFHNLPRAVILLIMKLQQQHALDSIILFTPRHYHIILANAN